MFAATAFIGRRVVTRVEGPQVTIHFAITLAALAGLGLTIFLYWRQSRLARRAQAQAETEAQRLRSSEHRFRQLASLIHPEHLGRSFKVLVQKKN